MEQTTQPITQKDIQIAVLTDQVKNLTEKIETQSEFLAGLQPVLDGVRDEIKAMRIDYASFTATTKAESEARDGRISRLENRSNAWDTLNSIGAILAALIGLR